MYIFLNGLFIVLVDRARQSFRQSLRFSSLRGRGLRLAGYLTPPSDATAEELESDGGSDTAEPIR